MDGNSCWNPEGHNFCFQRFQQYTFKLYNKKIDRYQRWARYKKLNCEM